MDALPGGSTSAYLKLAAERRARLRNGVSRKRPDEPTPQEAARSEVAEEKNEPQWERPVIVELPSVPQPWSLEAVPVPTISCQIIFEHVCDFYHVSMTELLSARRHMRVVWPRWIAMYLARGLTTQSLPSIGRKLGDKDHTTILHGVFRIEAALKTDEKLARDIEALTEIIKTGAKSRMIAPPVAANENYVPPTPKFKIRFRDKEPREFWRSDLAEVLKVMWERGDDINDIAKATGRSRAAVLGKAWRMRLTKRRVGTVLAYANVRKREFLIREVPFS